MNNIWCQELIIPFELDKTIEVVEGNSCIDTDTIINNLGWAEFYFENGGYANLCEGHIPGYQSIAYKKKIWEELGKLPEDLTSIALPANSVVKLAEGTKITNGIILISAKNGQNAWCN